MGDGMRRFVAGLVVGAVIASGSAYAARQITSRDIKNGTIKSVDLSEGIEQDIEQGGLVTENVSGNGTVPMDGSTRYASLLGAGATFTDVAEAYTLTPTDHYMHYDHFAAEATTSLEAGQSIELTFYVEDKPAGFICTISAPAQSCDSGQSSISIVNGKKVAMQIVGSGGSGEASVVWTMRSLYEP
jgi:hypothetical protein